MRAPCRVERLFNRLEKWRLVNWAVRRSTRYWLRYAADVLGADVLSRAVFAFLAPPEQIGKVSYILVKKFNCRISYFILFYQIL